MNIRTRIILLLSTTFVSLILVFSGVIYFLTSNYGFTDFYDRLRTRTNTTIRIQLDHQGDAEYLRRFKKELLVVLPQERDIILELSPLNKPIGIFPKDIRPDFIQQIVGNKQATFRSGEVFYYGKFYRSPHNKRFVIVTSARNDYYGSYTQYLRSLLLIVIVISVLLIVLVSIWLSKRLVKPLNKIREDITQIGTENLHIRLESKEGEQDEFGRLIQTLNLLFDRLETSFETQKNFISNASHELNTPLTSIIGQADLTLYRERSAEEYKTALQTILTEAEKLDKKTKALLFLAQTGYDGKRIQFSLLRVDQLIYDALDTVKRIVPGSKVRFNFETLPESALDLKVMGNEQLLILALSNIILNGCKYSQNELVEIWLTTAQKQLSIHIKDTGIGIPKADMPYIYDPYFRAANTSKFEGYGIGLPLTRNIMRLHKGKLIVQSEEEIGTLVTLELLLADLSKM